MLYGNYQHGCNTSLTNPIAWLKLPFVQFRLQCFKCKSLFKCWLWLSTWHICCPLRNHVMPFGPLSFSQGGGSDAERTKKKRRGDRYSVQTSLIVAALKKMLPIGLNMCSPADQELINLAKIRYSLVASSAFQWRSLLSSENCCIFKRQWPFSFLCENVYYLGDGTKC